MGKVQDLISATASEVKPTLDAAFAGMGASSDGKKDPLTSAQIEVLIAGTLNSKEGELVAAFEADVLEAVKNVDHVKTANKEEAAAAASP